jgi:hypothetical protein
VLQAVKGSDAKQESVSSSHHSAPNSQDLNGDSQGKMLQIKQLHANQASIDSNIIAVVINTNAAGCTICTCYQAN